MKAHVVTGISGAAGAFLAVLIVADVRAGPSVATRAMDSARAEVLDRRRADYREDEDPSRILADLQAELVRDGAGTRLLVAASAVGPRVVAPPGVEGVAGSNSITSREIETLLEEGRLDVVVRGPNGEEMPGRALAGRLGTIAQRRVQGDGTVVHVPAGGGPRLVELRCEAILLGEGRFDVEIRVDDVVRARARCRVDARGGRVLLLEGVGAHAPAGGRP